MKMRGLAVSIIYRLSVVVLSVVFISACATGQTKPNEKVVSNSKNINNVKPKTKKKSPANLKATEEKLRALLQSTEDKYGKDSEQVVIVLMKQLSLLGANPSYKDEVLLWVQRINRITRHNYGNRHREVAKTLGASGLILVKQRHFDLAEPMLKESIEIFNELGGLNPKPMLNLIETLSAIYTIKKRYRDALPLLEQRLVLIEQTLGSDNAKFAAALLTLANSHKIFMEYEKAIPYAERSFKMYKKHLPPEHIEVLTITKLLADIYMHLGRAEDALPLYQQRMAIQEKMLPKTHKYIINNLDRLARAYYELADYPNVLAIFERLLALQIEIDPENHAKLDTIKNNLALVYSKLGKYNLAESTYLQRIKSDEKANKVNTVSHSTTLSNLAVFYEARGQYDKALPLIKQSLKILRDNHPDSKREIAISLNNYGSILKSMGKYEQALVQLKSSHEMTEELLPADHPSIATGLHNLADLYRRMGRYDLALSAQKRSLAIREKVFPPAHPTIAASMNNLGLIYNDLGKFKEEIALYKRSLAIWQKAYKTDHPDIAQALNNIGISYLDLGDYERAKPLLERSLAMRKRILPPGHSDIGMSLNNMANYYSTVGKYDSAKEMRENYLAIKLKVLPANHPDIALGLENLSSWYKSMGRYAEALEYLKKAIKIYEKSSLTTHPDYAFALDSLARIYMKLGQFEQAMPLLQKSLRIMTSALSTDHWRVAGVMNNISLLYGKIGEKEKSLDYMERSFAILKKVLPADHPEVASGASNLAVKYKHLGHYKKAEKLYLYALELRKKILPAGHPDTALTESNLGYLYLTTDNLDQAEKYLQGSVASMQSNIAAREFIWITKYGLFGVAEKQGDYDLAIIWGKEAVNTIQAMRADLGGLDKKLQTSFLKGKREIYQELADLMISIGRLNEAQTVLQMLKEDELFETLRSTKNDPRSMRIELTGLEWKRFSHFYDLQKQQIVLVKEYEKLERKDNRGDINEAEAQRLIEINEQLLPPLRDAMVVFLQELQKQSEQYSKDKAYRQGELKLAQVETNLQKALVEVKRNDPDAKIAALQYVVTDNRLSILLSTPNNPPLARQIKYDGKGLRNQIFTVRELLSDPKSDRKILKQHLQVLYSKLIAPIAQELNTLEVKALVLVPNDVLRYVPFAALFDGKRYLVQDYTLTLFNEAVKKDFSKSVQGEWQLAAMGLSQAVEHLPALSNVPDELNAVATKSGLKGITYLDDKFTRVVLNDSLNQKYNVLHLASHFEFVAGRPDASRFFLGDKSSLYLGDIARENMRFDKFSLVTFSACETGLGGGLDADGRDMESLGALVQNQGASAVMATLWKVEDSSTATLMETFYRVRHEDKLHKAEALRKAQLKFIKRGGGRSVLAHPYYWAPFVLMGDWR